MYIGAIADGKEKSAKISSTFEQGKYLLVVDTENLEVMHILPNPDGTGMAFAKQLEEMDCEAVVCGTIQKEAFEAVALAGITRYYGAGESVEKAVPMAEQNELGLICDFEGGTGCGDHDHECECGESE